jgi:hypothetical protein
MKDLGQLHHFLGVTVEPRQTGLLLTSSSMPWISWSVPG